jgi:predicted nuclease with RNAse H fold
MAFPSRTVIGIDIGGKKKGFHAVVLRKGQFETHHFAGVEGVAEWCSKQKAQAIAIDAPCAWATAGKSRRAERELAIGGETIQCFKTPTRAIAQGRSFYGWVFNGEELYQSLAHFYPLFNGTTRTGKIVFETFPHAVVCALVGHVVPARPKVTTRRKILREQGYDDTTLANIDYVDAALCALTAERFLLGKTISFGDQAEGFIVVPSSKI